MTEKGTKVVKIGLEKEQYSKLEAAAKAYGLPLAAYCRYILMDHILSKGATCKHCSFANGK